MNPNSPRETVHLTYYEENDRVFSGFVELVELTDTTVTFHTSSNEITIPLSRLIRLKRRLDEANP
jgi:hypothetical protein